MCQETYLRSGSGAEYSSPLSKLNAVCNARTAFSSIGAATTTEILIVLVEIISIFTLLSAFLERCRQTVAQFGRIDRLNTLHVVNGRTLVLGDNTVDATFSYITLQHCQPQDAIELVNEAIRVTRSGGTIVLNFRTWVLSDVVLVPLGVAMRALWKVSIIGPRLARWRWSTRIGWQANRLNPNTVLAKVAPALCEIKVFHSVKRKLKVSANSQKSIKTIPTNRINPSHWWLVAQVS